MRTTAAPTYLVPDDDCVTGGAWTTDDGIEAPERLDHWDPVTDLHLSRALTVDLDAVRSQCGLGPDAAFAVIASWRSPTRTRLGGAGEAIELGTLDGLIRASVAVHIAGPESGGRVDLTSRLVLRDAGSRPSPISPRRTGAILWTDTTRVALEGSAARFPVTATDFHELARVPDGAAWYVDWDPEDLDSPILGGLRLLLNTAHPKIISAARTSSEDPSAPIVRSLIECDVARHLVRTALTAPAFLDAPDTFPDESVGRLLTDLVATIWPGIPISTLTGRALQDPARLDADIQAALGVAK